MFSFFLFTDDINRDNKLCVYNDGIHSTLKINLVRHPQNIRSIFYSYCENVTTLHGYGHIVRNKSNFLRILWSVVVFGLLVVLACFTFEAFDDFVQRKVLTQVKVVLDELALYLSLLFALSRFHYVSLFLFMSRFNLYQGRLSCSTFRLGESCISSFKYSGSQTLFFQVISS